MCSIVGACFIPTYFQFSYPQSYFYGIRKYLAIVSTIYLLYHIGRISDGYREVSRFFDGNSVIKKKQKREMEPISIVSRIPDFYPFYWDAQEG